MLEGPEIMETSLAAIVSDLPEFCSLLPEIEEATPDMSFGTPAESWPPESCFLFTWRPDLADSGLSDFCM